MITMQARVDSFMSRRKPLTFMYAFWFTFAGDIGALGWWDLFINYGYDLYLDYVLLVVEFHVEVE